jgi:hypothetical protein
MHDVTDPEGRIKAKESGAVGIKGVTVNSFVCSGGYAKNKLTSSLNNLLNH